MTVRRQEIKRSLCAPAELFMNEKKQRDPFLATGLLVMQMARAYGGIFMQIVRIFKPNLTSLRCLQSAPAFCSSIIHKFHNVTKRLHNYLQWNQACKPHSLDLSTNVHGNVCDSCIS